MVLECPECGTDIEIPPNTLRNEFIVCPECSVELEVGTSGDEMVLNYAPAAEEDWGE